jgi:hypothetical protein
MQGTRFIGGGWAPKFFGLRAVLMAPEGADGTAASGGEQKKDEGAPAAPTAAELAELRAAKAELETIKSGKAKEANEEAAKQAKAAADAAAAGDLKKALEIQNKRLAELEPYEAEVKRLREQEAEQLKAIETKKATLTETQRAAVDAAPTLAGKQAVLAALGASTTAASTKTTAAASAAGTGTGAPAADGTIDFAAALKDPVKWAEAKAKFPQAAAAWMSTTLSGGRKQSTIDALRAKPVASK